MPAAGGSGSKRWCVRCSGWRRVVPSCSGWCAKWVGSGPPAATRFTLALDPLVARASSFLAAEMDAGHMRRHEPRLLLLAIYSTVVGMITEVEVMRMLGEEPSARSLVRRRQEILLLLRSALVVEPAHEGGRRFGSRRLRGRVALRGGGPVTAACFLRRLRAAPAALASAIVRGLFDALGLGGST